MKKIPCFSLILGVVAMMATGCATTRHPKTLTPEIAAKVQTVNIVKEIHTPTALFVPEDVGYVSIGGGFVGAAISAAISEAIAAQRQKALTKAFTEEVRANLDFQKFAEEALRESFIKAVSSYPCWKLVPSDAKADAAFLLEVEAMGLQTPWPPSMAKYSPTIWISVMLIGNPPFEIVRTGGKVQVLDPANHPIYYHRREYVRPMDKLPRYFLREYSSDPEIFKSAFQKAIDIVVERIAASWTTGGASR